MKIRKKLGIKTARELALLLREAGKAALSADTLTLWLIGDEARLRRFLELVCEGVIPKIDEITYEDLGNFVADFFTGSGGKLAISTAVSQMLSDKEMVRQLMTTQNLTNG